MIARDFYEITSVVADVRVRLSHLVSDGQSLAIIGRQLVQALEKEMEEEEVQVEGRTTWSRTTSSVAGVKDDINLKQNSTKHIC
jgi:hypothetical protein